MMNLDVETELGITFDKARLHSEYHTTSSEGVLTWVSHSRNVQRVSQDRQCC